LGRDLVLLLEQLFDRALGDRDRLEARDVGEHLLEPGPDAALGRGPVDVVAELAQLLELVGHRRLDLDVALAQRLELADLGVLDGPLLMDALFEGADRDTLAAVGNVARDDVRDALGGAHGEAKGATGGAWV